MCSAIEEMAGMDMLCSDKTGTLTLNKMVIQDDCPIYTRVSLLHMYMHTYIMLGSNKTGTLTLNKIVIVE
jgi:P-type E1-E2 ATPase